MLDPHRLRVFRAVVSSGSVQAAAHHLGYTPSAVSQQLAQLQRETGLQLFEKAGRGIVPTAVGKVLAAESDEVVGALSRLDDLVADLRVGRTARLSVACFASVGEEWVPRLARGLQAEFADVHLDIDLIEIEVPGTRKRPMTDLTVRTEVPGEVMPVPAGYARTALVQEPYAVVLPAGHRLADAEEIALADLAGEPWIDERVPGQTCAIILDRALRSAGITPRVVARCQDHHTSMALTAAGLGVCLVPRLTLGALPGGTVARPVTAPTPTRDIAVLLRDGAGHTPVAVRAVALLREIAGQEIAA